MKLHEINPHELDEGLKGGIASAMLGISSLIPSHMIDKLPPKPSNVQLSQWKAQTAKKEAHTVINALKAKYKSVDEQELVKIFNLAKKYEKPVFPKAADILAIIGIESSFNPNAVSKLKHDPAKGLMQVRPAIWGMNPKELNGIEQQVKFGADILHKYYERLGDADDAVHAYNVGITNLKRGTGLNPGYVQKFNRERTWLGHVWNHVT